MLRQPALRAENALISTSLADAERHFVVEGGEGIEPHLRELDVVIQHDLTVPLRCQNIHALVGRTGHLIVGPSHLSHWKRLDCPHLEVNVIVLQGGKLLDSRLGIPNHFRKVISMGDAMKQCQTNRQRQSKREASPEDAESYLRDRQRTENTTQSQIRLEAGSRLDERCRRLHSVKREAACLSTTGNKRCFWRDGHDWNVSPWTGFLTWEVCRWTLQTPATHLSLLEQTHHFIAVVLNVGGMSLDNCTSTFNCFLSASAFFICLRARRSISLPYR